MTDKRNRKDVPECEHGFWGGFSPKRIGKYEDQYLTKQHESSGGSRIFPGNRKVQGTIKQSYNSSNKEAKISVQNLDNLDTDTDKNSQLKVSISNPHEHIKVSDEKIRGHKIFEKNLE